MRGSPTPPRDLAGLLDQGRHRLLDAYCLGDEQAPDYAAPCFFEAISQTQDPHGALYWVALQYVNLGFLADGAEMLMELLSRFEDASARRLLAEVRWWRDNAHRLPWLPPAGDGSRYARMMRAIDPGAPTHAEMIAYWRERLKQVGNAPTRQPLIDPEIASLFGSAMPAADENPVDQKPLVDWSFLDRDHGQPGEPADWVRKEMKLFREHADEIYQMHRRTRQIPPPASPPRRDPHEPPFDPSEILGAMDFDSDDDDQDVDDANI